jgi:hypothetical protein
MAAASVIAASPTEVAAETPKFVAPDEWIIDFDLIKPCDMRFDEDYVEGGVDLDIYDLSNSRAYEGYIKWWALHDLDNPRGKAFAFGYAQVVDGLVAIRFP